MSWRWWAMIPAALGSYLVVGLVHAQVLQWVTWRGPQLVAFATVMAALAGSAWVISGVVLVREKACLVGSLLAGVLVVVDAWQMITVPVGLSQERRVNTLLPLAVQAITSITVAAAVCARSRRDTRRASPMHEPSRP